MLLPDKPLGSRDTGDSERRGDGAGDSPRPQSGPLNPKKQWQVPATQSPFPKQLLGQSSIESARKQSGGGGVI